MSGNKGHILSPKILVENLLLFALMPVVRAVFLLEKHFKSESNVMTSHTFVLHTYVWTVITNDCLISD